ncbi:MAG: DsrE family protein [Candidatus Methanosuratincola sp.]
MEKAVVIINEPPSSMRAWNGFRLAAALIGADLECEVFLLNDGVFCALSGQNTPDELAGQNTGRKIRELMELGVSLRLCTQCAQTRGITEEMVVGGVSWVSMVDLAKSIRDSAKVVSF